MSDYTILLPPSEGKQAGGAIDRSWQEITEQPALNAFDMLNPYREQLIAALKQVTSLGSASELQKIFGVKGDALAAAVAANGRLPDGPLLPAIERYTGVMFDFIEYASLSAAAQDTFDSHVILFSGLWGLLRPSDAIPDYRLKMDASLPAVGRIATFWRPMLSSVLNERLAGEVIWDFLPGAHAAAWSPGADIMARWQIKFVERVDKDGAERYRTVSHWSKALKGALVRFICEHQVSDPAAFCEFTHPQGYAFEPSKTVTSKSGSTLVFVKQ